MEKREYIAPAIIESFEIRGLAFATTISDDTDGGDLWDDVGAKRRGAFYDEEEEDSSDDDGSYSGGGNYWE